MYPDVVRAASIAVKWAPKLIRFARSSSGNEMALLESPPHTLKFLIFYTRLPGPTFHFSSYYFLFLFSGLSLHLPRFGARPRLSGTGLMHSHAAGTNGF